MASKLLLSISVTLFSLVLPSSLILADSHRGVSEDHISDTGSEHRSDGQIKDKDKQDKTKDKKVKKDKKSKKK